MLSISGQYAEEEILDNNENSKNFDEFITILGINFSVRAQLGGGRGGRGSGSGIQLQKEGDESL